MAITRYLMANDVGSNNSWPPKRIGIESGGRIWYVYEDTGNDINALYSDDGESWIEETGFFINSLRNPSLAIDSNDNLHVSTSHPTYVNIPRYCKRTSGSWGSVENIDIPAGSQFSQIVVTSGDKPYCAWRFAPSGTYNQVKAAKRTASWQADVVLDLASGWKLNSISGCIDDSDNIQVIWQAQNISDSTSYSIQTAYWNGTSWSSIATIEAYNTSSSTGAPIIRRVGRYLIALWSRDGVAPYSTKTQIRYSISTDNGANWTTADHVTEFDGNHFDYDAVAGDGSDIYVIYTEYGADPSNPTIYNVAYKQWDGTTWSSKTPLTEESADQRYVSAVNNGSIIYLVWRETSTTSIYSGYFTSTATPTTREIYDYVSTMAADVAVTLELDPQIVLTEIGGKGDIIHLADDDSEERVGFSSSYTFYVNIRYDLLNEADAGTLLDLWANTSSADGRKNSFLFSHPDGHVYVVRFDTDLTRLMSPTFYSVKNIRLRVLGRIAD